MTAERSSFPPKPMDPPQLFPSFSYWHTLSLSPSLSFNASTPSLHPPRVYKRPAGLVEKERESQTSTPQPRVAHPYSDQPASRLPQQRSVFGIILSPWYMQCIARRISANAVFLLFSSFFFLLLLYTPPVCASRLWLASSYAPIPALDVILFWEILHSGQDTKRAKLRSSKRRGNQFLIYSGHLTSATQKAFIPFSSTSTLPVHRDGGLIEPTRQNRGKEEGIRPVR